MRDRHGGRQLTRYELCCQGARKRFDFKVKDHASGDQNPGKVGQFLGELPVKPNRAIPGSTPTDTESESEIVEELADFVENAPWVSDSGAGREVTTTWPISQRCGSS